MLKLQEIQEKLTRIDSSTFQDLCDAYIFYTEPYCDNIHRTGSQVGKQKAVKGTPDSYYVLPNGKYVLLEYTTQSLTPKKAFLTKIKSDIIKCVNPEKTGLQLSDIEKITYCINCDLAPADHKALMEYAFDKRIRLDIKSLSTFAMGLLSKASPLAKQFLGIAIDSGQILDTAGFIKAYEHSGYSTPLNNYFIGREDELRRLKESALSSAVTILTGSPGVGKTKLALALLEQLKQNALPIKIYCIDNKHVPIYHDLKTFLPSTENCILFIDDANRQMNNLKPILGLLKEDRIGKLHIIVTIRDYALDEIEQLTSTFSPSIIRLKKLSDEQLTAILASPDFEIRNERYVKRILEIADGSPRLAIMAAMVVTEKQTLDSLHDVTDLYDRYFEKAVPPIVFANQLFLKTMGIVSFFNNINKEDGDRFNQTLSNFGVNQHEFCESIVELEKLELVESSSDLLTYKIADQVLGTYFFYYTFLKKTILNFNTILQHYFHSHLYRVRDTIIPANNTFGSINVYNKIEPNLSDFWKQINNQEEAALKFLDIFWFFKQDETLSFVYKKINSMTAISNLSLVYNKQKISNDYGSRDNYLHLLQNFFYHPLDTLKDSLTLAILYTTKTSSQYGYLVQLIKECFIFNPEDEDDDFYRQHVLINILADDISEITLEVRTRLFYDIMPTFMKTSFQVISSARKRDTMTLYKYDLPLTEHIKELRTSIWVLFNQLFPENPTDSILFFKEYMQLGIYRKIEVFAYDRPYLVDIIKLHFTPNYFAHCLLVQDFVNLFKKLKIKGDNYDELKATFTNEPYQVYIVLSNNYRRGKLDRSIKLRVEEAQNLKEKEIRRHFSIFSVHEFMRFYAFYVEIDQILHLFNHNYNLQYSLEIVMHAAFLKDKSNLSFYYIVAQSNNPTKFVPYKILGELAHDLVEYREFKSSFDKYDFLLKDLWLNNWFLLLPDSGVKMNDRVEFLSLLQGSTNIHYIETSLLDKFQSTDPNFFKDLLHIVYQKNLQGSRINLHEIFKNKLDVISLHMDLAKKSYLQQKAQIDRFDYNYKIFYQLLNRDITFIRDYISFWSTSYLFSLKQHEGLGIAWNHPDAHTVIEQGMDCLCEQRVFSLRENVCNVLFREIPTDKKDNAVKFLKDYLLKNKTNEVRVDAAFNCIRLNFFDSLEVTLLSFLEAQSSFDLFTKIGWTTGFLMGNENTSFGEIRARQYTDILNILEKIEDKPYRYSEHKAYLKERIASEKKNAERERKRKFLRQD